MIIFIPMVAVLMLLSLPWWLPRSVVALRERIFARINGEEGVPVPGKAVPVEEFKRVYADPAANGRSHGAALSDLFWYWLAPGPEVHQEHLEPGPRYQEAARTTRTILARLRKDEWEALVARCADHVLAEVRPGSARLRDVMMPIWAEVYYEAVFAEPCPRTARDLIVANADDVVSALKCTRLRHMGRRAALTRYLRARIAAGDTAVPLPSLFSAEEQAFYLQGAFFNTAIVQMSEACAHVLMALAAHPVDQQRVRTDGDTYAEHVLDETMRRWPLFGIAHRVTTAPIEVDADTVLPPGSVLLFNYSDYQDAGLPDAHHFDPDRWARHPGSHPGLDPGATNFIPFGISANRPCPARGIAPPSMRVVIQAVLARFTLATSAAHTRSLPNRGPVLLRSDHNPPRVRRTAARLTLMRLKDRWEDVWRSLVQLVLGTYMVIHARRLRLCQTYFAAHPAEIPPRTPTSGSTGCPVHAHPHS